MSMIFHGNGIRKKVRMSHLLPLSHLRMTVVGQEQHMPLERQPRNNQGDGTARGETCVV